MSEQPKFNVGDMVNCERWDKTVSEKQRLGIQRVTEVLTDQCCQSGVLVKLEGYWSHLDQDWLRPVNEKELEFQI